MIQIILFFLMIILFFDDHTFFRILMNYLLSEQAGESSTSTVSMGVETDKNPTPHTCN